jgi:hypothetical protein
MSKLDDYMKQAQAYNLIQELTAQVFMEVSEDEEHVSQTILDITVEREMGDMRKWAVDTLRSFVEAGFVPETIKTTRDMALVVDVLLSFAYVNKEVSKALIRKLNELTD